MVLIGETGSGKSTQLVQFLVDSGIAANDSIICTQPRKIAAVSLAQRVREESSGCYEDNSIICYPTYSSARQFLSKVTYMTDHCLLQHYMNDKNLSGISCIIVDEAHERSLNTDLLLALIKALLSQKLDMRVIIMSATADADQLSKYAPCASEGTSGSATIASYVLDVMRMANEIHKTEKEGTILAFLTSQMEVEWACEKFQAPSAVALALHGKLSYEEQFRVKYVIDSGMVKESRFEPGTGMNVLRVCSISQSSANQRAGRAGRTEPGRCYRLYSKDDFELMPPHQEPEIRRVHLGVAVLRILALGIKNLEHFDFVDAPSGQAIDMAIRNLLQLGAVTLTNDFYDLTEEGRCLVKLGIEPRLGKLILNCFHHRLGREGLVLAAVMANASSIFCRVGNDEDKLKSDRLKVQFCHRDGDLFTLLSVYKEWEWCLKNELRIIIPTYWRWNPHNPTIQDRYLKKVILSSLSENVAMYSGYDQLGYEVALTGQYVQLHPACSLLIFGEKPSWVVFGEILSISNQYLVCVTAFDIDSLPTIFPPLFDVSKMESRKLQTRKMTGFGSTLLKKFCGKANNNLIHLISQIRTSCMDVRIGIEVKVDQNEILLFASSKDMEKVGSLVNDVLEYERKWLQNECIEKCLYHERHGVAPPLALFGAGAEIKHLELEKRCLSVDFTGTGQDSEERWGRITFLTPDSAKKATDLNKVEFRGSLLKVIPSRTTFGGNHKMFPFPAVKAKVYWPRRQSKGFGIVKCDRHDVDFMVNDFSNLLIGGRYLRCEGSAKYMDSVVISGLDKELSEAEILDELRTATNRRIFDFFLVRGDAVKNPSCGACEEALLREISPFMSKTNPMAIVAKPSKSFGGNRRQSIVWLSFMAEDQVPAVVS
ncbi:ATP-dependent RNA helicase DEAH12, chloroplastic [Vitis vinifera]|uniref:RNA helicase n=1 Tax=Vitis vinifera TaxID=29760 RepID=A0A438FC83_VITVI|nr:ATP-dependent RNA helicase DEAH12, chloroplastic [Vitis vinifera]